MKNVVVKLAPESSFVGILPFSIDDFEGNVLVRRASMESQIRKVLVVCTGSLKIETKKRCIGIGVLRVFNDAFNYSREIPQDGF